MNLKLTLVRYTPKIAQKYKDYISMFIFFLALIVAEIAVFFNTMSSPRLTKLSSRRLTKLLPFQVTLNQLTFGQMM